MKCSPSSVIFLLIAVLLMPLPAAAGQRAPLVQSIEVQIPAAPLPVTIAGKRYLAYELHLSNFRAFDVELLRVEVIGSDGPLASFSGPDLAERLIRIGAPAAAAERQRVSAGGRAVLYLWLPLEPDVATPARLDHNIEVDLLRQSGRERTVVSKVECVVRNEQPVVLDMPLRGGPWVALYDPTMLGGHRTSIYTLDGRARIPSRFAIDWVKLAGDATRAHGDASTIANWHGYGAEVLAVADGTIVDAIDDMQEAAAVSAATGSIALENASGNYVILDLGNHRYAFYEHLKHGSIKVKRGARVKRGDVIASLGNSGSSSSGPHLHFHVADAPSALAAEGLPYVFRNFEVLGAYDDIEGFTTGERWKPAASGGDRRMESPAANSVIVFSAR